MRAAAVALVIVLSLLGSGCGGDDDAAGDDDGPSSSLIDPQSTVAPGQTTGPGETTAPVETTASTTTAPIRPTAATAEARDAVDELKAAWEAGDRARAAAIAPGDVVEALFVVPPDGFEVQGCDTGEFDTSSCTFRNRATEAFISVSATRTEAGWQIATIDVNVD